MLAESIANGHSEEGETERREEEGEQRDLTYAGTTGGSNLQSTSQWVYVILSTNIRSAGNYVYTGQHSVVVPEPGTLPLMLMGLAAIGLGLGFRPRRATKVPQTA